MQKNRSSEVRSQRSEVRVRVNLFSVLSPQSSGRLGFTLVEMMVAVSILGIGIVLISRSFLNSISVLDTLQNRIGAVYFLGYKMSDLEEESLENNGVKTGETQEEADLGSRKADFKKEITAIDIEEMKDDLNKVKLSLYWTEGNRQKDETLVTYLPAKK